MQSLNILLTQTYLYCHSQSPDISLPKPFLDFSQSGIDPISQLSVFLDELELPRNTVLTLILDHTYISYYSFGLPHVSKRKINRILEFELADNLIDEIDEYYYDYNYQGGKDQETKIGVYLIKKELLHQIVQTCKEKNLEIRWVLSQDNLIDLFLKGKYKPENTAIVVLEKSTAKVFAYRDGFLIGCSNSNLIHRGKTADTNPTEIFNDINWKIKAIRFQEEDISDVILEEDDHIDVRITDKNELFPQSDGELNLPESYGSKLVKITQPGRSNHINLLKSNLFIFEEVKKHSVKFIISLTAVFICLVLYVGSIIYENSIKTEYYESLRQRYEKTLDQYLPKESSRANAISILKNRVNELKEIQEKNRKYATRTYLVSDQLARLSELKQKVSSLKLNRFFMADQSIRIQGEVNSIAEYDLLKQNIERIYPPESYSTKFNQKSLGDAVVQFSTTIRSLEKQ